MRNLIGVSLAVAAFVAGLLTYQQVASTKPTLSEPTQASTLSPFDLMTSRGKNLPEQNWPAF